MKSITDEPKRRFSSIMMDVDGTLLDFDEAERRGVAEVLRAHGIEPARALLLRYHKINDQFWKAFERGDIAKEEILTGRFPAFFKTLGIEVESQTEEQRYRRQLDSCAILMDGALDICGYLKEKGYRLYIVTNGIASTQHARLDASGLTPYFDDIFISEEVGSQKPQKEYFDYCFTRIPEKDLSRILIVGDSLTSDIQGGKNSGISTCLANFGNLRRIAGIKADYEITKLSELKRLL